MAIQNVAKSTEKVNSTGKEGGWDSAKMSPKVKVGASVDVIYGQPLTKD